MAGAPPAGRCEALAADLGLDDLDDEWDDIDFDAIEASAAAHQAATPPAALESAAAAGQHQNAGYNAPRPGSAHAGSGGWQHSAPWQGPAPAFTPPGGTTQSSAQTVQVYASGTPYAGAPAPGVAQPAHGNAGSSYANTAAAPAPQPEPRQIAPGPPQPGPPQPGPHAQQAGMQGPPVTALDAQVQNMPALQAMELKPQPPHGGEFDKAYPWTHELQRCNQQHFANTSFRGCQEQVRSAHRTGRPCAGTLHRVGIV